jgi:hypothetical protein
MDSSRFGYWRLGCWLSWYRWDDPCRCRWSNIVERSGCPGLGGQSSQHIVKVSGLVTWITSELWRRHQGRAVVFVVGIRRRVGRSVDGVDEGRGIVVGVS